LVAVNKRDREVIFGWQPFRPKSSKGDSDEPLVGLCELNFGLGSSVSSGNKFMASNILLHERDYR
jgi:hypothetical protein